jgi:hypothetical protein
MDFSFDLGDVVSVAALLVSLYVFARQQRQTQAGLQLAKRTVDLDEARRGEELLSADLRIVVNRQMSLAGRRPYRTIQRVLGVSEPTLRYDHEAVVSNRGSGPARDVVFRWKTSLDGFTQESTTALLDAGRSWSINFSLDYDFPIYAEVDWKDRVRPEGTTKTFGPFRQSPLLAE